MMRRVVGGWRLSGSASDFIISDVCCTIWNAQDVTEAPLVKSIDWLIRRLRWTSYRPTRRLCIIEEYQHDVGTGTRSTVGSCSDTGASDIAIESLHFMHKSGISIFLQNTVSVSLPPAASMHDPR